jgi:hypothetical protein
MKGFYSFLALAALVILAPRSKAQYSPLEDYREDVNLNRKNFSDRNPQKVIEINVADLPESDADKNRIQKGYDNLVAAVQTKSGEEVNRVLDNLDILTKQKVLHKFIQNFKSLQAESILEQGKEEDAIKAEEKLPEQSDQ